MSDITKSGYVYKGPMSICAHRMTQVNPHTKHINCQLRLHLPKQRLSTISFI